MPKAREKRLDRITKMNERQTPTVTRPDEPPEEIIPKEFDISGEAESKQLERFNETKIEEVKEDVGRMLQTLGVPMLAGSMSSSVQPVEVPRHPAAQRAASDAGVAAKALKESIPRTSMGPGWHEAAEFGYGKGNFRRRRAEVSYTLDAMRDFLNKQAAAKDLWKLPAQSARVINPLMSAAAALTGAFAVPLTFFDEFAKSQEFEPQLRFLAHVGVKRPLRSGDLDPNAISALRDNPEQAERLFKEGTLSNELMDVIDFPEETAPDLPPGARLLDAYSGLRMGREET